MHGRRFRGDAGAATTEFVLVAPLLLFTIMVVVQAGLYFHAVAVASAAAQEGARTATMEGSNAGLGAAEAEAFVEAVAPELLPNPVVNGQETDNGEAVRITVQGEVSRIYDIPGLNLAVNESAESTIERFRPADDAPPTDGP